MEDKNYTEEQKTYLVNRLEQGDSLEMMKKYASPSLSVEYMEWLRKIDAYNE